MNSQKSKKESLKNPEYRAPKFQETVLGFILVIQIWLLKQLIGINIFKQFFWLKKLPGSRLFNSR